MKLIENLELVILAFIIISFLIFRNFLDDKKEGASCISTSFAFNPTTVGDDGSYGGEDGSSGDPTAATANYLMDKYVTIMDEIKNDMNFIKGVIPVQFQLGMVNNSDTAANMGVYGILPNVFLDFTMKNPPFGPTGEPGEDSEKYGPTGDVGKPGPVGENGYWGTTKYTLY